MERFFGLHARFTGRQYVGTIYSKKVSGTAVAIIRFLEWQPRNPSYSCPDDHDDDGRRTGAPDRFSTPEAS